MAVPVTFAYICYTLSKLKYRNKKQVINGSYYTDYNYDAEDAAASNIESAKHSGWICNNAFL